ncbi:hypothetical protein DFH28DRAFT_879333 [Melampsora americana]|nr:hypothetical protein DFH28DRAFT_879333 [Melampsora americana]
MSVNRSSPGAVCNHSRENFSERPSYGKSCCLGCSSATEDSSDDNRENLLEQVDNYKDWSSVVYRGALTHNTPAESLAETSPGQNDGWYPFGKPEETIAMMIYGSARNQLTCRQYKACHSAVSLAGLKLPNYKTLKALLNRAENQMGLKLNSTTSPLGNSCHSSERPIEIGKALACGDLAKPHVTRNLAFYLAVERDGFVKEFIHCEKWINGFPSWMRAPMVYSSFGHFYLYEPVQLNTGRVVVPTHFYYFGNDLVAKCLQLQLVDYDHPRDKGGKGG